MCSFGIARRPGYGKDVSPPIAGAKTRFVDITAVDISSTDIRERLSEGKSIRFLVPAGVETYIRAHKVYPSGQGS
jgi:nicotinate-nucleotide adenylyltransferase